MRALGYFLCSLGCIFMGLGGGCSIFVIFNAITSSQKFEIALLLLPIVVGSLPISFGFWLFHEGRRQLKK
jgi:hypothetical protein